MYNAPLLGNGRCCGNRVMADMSGTWWDVTTQVSSKRQVIAFPTFCNMAAVRHLEYELKFGIDPIFPAEIFHDFIILPLWLENA